MVLLMFCSHQGAVCQTIWKKIFKKSQFCTWRQCPCLFKVSPLLNYTHTRFRKWVIMNIFIFTGMSKVPLLPREFLKNWRQHVSPAGVLLFFKFFLSNLELNFNICPVSFHSRRNNTKQVNCPLLICISEGF